MSKFQIKATELQAPSVELVSLVKRGANRIPFRITKEDNEMSIDLHKIGRGLFTKAAASPEVVAVLLSKEADPVKITAAFAKRGLDISKFAKSEADGVVTLAKAGTANTVGGDALVLKMNDDVALVVTELKKDFSSYNFESTMFSEVMGQGSFFPSICTAQDMLSMTILNIMEKAETPKDAAAMIAKAASDFGSYVTQMAKGLPVQAFKADVELRKSVKDPDGDGDNDQADWLKANPSKTAADWKALTPEARMAWAKKNKGSKTTKAEEISAAPAIDTNADRPTGHGGKGNVGEGAPSNDIEGTNVETANAGARPTGHGGKNDIQGQNAPSNDIEGNSVERAGDTPAATAALAVAKAANDAAAVKKPSEGGTGNQLPDDKSGAGAEALPAADQAVIKSLLEGFTASLTKTLNEGMAAVKADVEKVSARVSAVAEQVKKQDEALGGTVLGSDAGDRTGHVGAEPSGEPALIDTALMRVSQIEKMDNAFRRKTAA